jgi:cation diffusion facilitator family transporter
VTGRKPPPHDDIARDIAKGRRLAILSLLYLCSTVTILFIVTSGSQALKTEFVGDALSMIPPILFLVGNRISSRAATPTYPFGYERAVSAGYLGSALALLCVGLFLLFDSGMKLAMKQHPSIGGLALFGHTVWIGWLGIGALLWSSIPAFFLGRAKKKLGKRLGDKILMADAQMNEADWQSAGAAILGVAGIAFGLWWADSLAALFISFEIIRDGVSELRAALGDLMDRRPQLLGGKEPDPVVDKLTDHLRGEPWIEDVVVRVREIGRELAAEAFVVPRQGSELLPHLREAGGEACKVDDRLREVVIAPVPAFPEEVEAIRPRA